MPDYRKSLIVVTLAAATVALAACGPREAKPTTEVSTTSQATVPPPPGDSTPKAVDSGTRTAVEVNEKASAPGSQATVGTAASGAPPYTMGSAPEGNQAPAQGSAAKK